MSGRKISTLGFAILGLLSGEAMSGYDVRRRMGDPVGFFWRASHSQIYPELARLEGMGLVSHRVVPQQGKPDRKVYEVSPSGREAVGEWVSEPPKIGPTRDEATLKAYLSWLGDPQKISENFKEQAEAHEEQLRKYREMEDWMREEWGGLEELGAIQFANYAALKRGIGYEQEYAGWCRWMAENISGVPASPDTPNNQ